MIKPTLIVLLASSLAGLAETQEQSNKSFAARPGGKIIVDVDFGSIEVTTNGASEVTVDVLRKITRPSKSDEETFLREHPVTISQDDGTVTVTSRFKPKIGWWGGSQRNEAKYALTVPASFAAQLRTAGGGVLVNDLSGGVKAETSGGGFRFARLHGVLEAHTSGGGIRLADCEGQLRIRTSGGGIDVAGGSGVLDGETSGGSVSVKGFRGPARVGSSGGGINIENVTGKVEGSTSGGSISAQFSSPLSEEVKLETSGGGVTLKVPESSAFDLDASTSGGSVHSEIPVESTGKVERNRLKGPANGGGKQVVLRTSGGSIHVKKS